ncbi:MAG: hypothetical protein QOI98_1814 [Solirubrobacteraceae bacterium]|nr:hypothetical protein [Solirubrobacteraceae bacterium]
MTFNPTRRTRKIVATLLAAGIAGGATAGVVAASRGAPAQTPTPTVVKVTAAAKTSTSTVPKPLTRAETAAEDVIGFLEKGQPAKSKAEALVLRNLAHGQAADALRQAGVPSTQIKLFQQRADRTAWRSLTNAQALQTSLAANSVSQLMPGFYARYQDPVPAAVLKLDYLDREVHLRSQAGQQEQLSAAVRQLESTWQQVRPQLVKAGGTTEATAYDAHIKALQRGGTTAAIQKQAVTGLDIVDKMEGVFLGK